MGEKYGKPAANQYSKLLSDIPEVDALGCNIQGPHLPCSHREDWGLEDPTGKSDGEFPETIRVIEEKILTWKPE